MSFQSYDEHNLENLFTRIANADGSSWKTFLNAPPVARRVDAILVANDDTVDHIVELAYQSGGNRYPVGGLNIPAGTGTLSTDALDLVGALMPTGLDAVLQTSDATVDVRSTDTVTAGKFITLLAIGGRF